MNLSSTPDAHFIDGGENYARYRPTYPDSLGALLAEHAPGDGLAVEAGCGSGQLSKILSHHFDKVIACDISPSQIKNAHRYESVSYHVAPADQLPAAADCAHLICAAQSAHWFRLESFFAEAMRVAAPGALLALITYGVMEVEPPLREVFNQFYWHDIHSYWPAERYQVETAYAELPFPFQEIPAPLLRIEREWNVDALIGYVDTWSATKAAKRANKNALFEKFSEEAKTLIGDETINVSWPLSIRMANL